MESPERTHIDDWPLDYSFSAQRSESMDGSNSRHLPPQESRSLAPPNTSNEDIPSQLYEVELRGQCLVCLEVNGEQRLCLAQISSTLLKDYSYNEIHNRRVALGITCVQCSPGQLEALREMGAMPPSSRRCGTITVREAERLVKSFVDEPQHPRLPESFTFEVMHRCGWGGQGQFVPARYTSSRAKCVRCAVCQTFFSPNKFIFHSHMPQNVSSVKPVGYRHPDAANFNAWRRHLFLADPNPPRSVVYSWEDVKAMFNGGTRKKIIARHHSMASACLYNNTKFGEPVPFASVGPPYHLPERLQTTFATDAPKHYGESCVIPYLDTSRVSLSTAGGNSGCSLKLYNTESLKGESTRKNGPPNTRFCSAKSNGRKVVRPRIKETNFAVSNSQLCAKLFSTNQPESAFPTFRFEHNPLNGTIQPLDIVATSIERQAQAASSSGHASPYDSRDLLLYIPSGQSRNVGTELRETRSHSVSDTPLSLWSPVFVHSFLNDLKVPVSCSPFWNNMWSSNPTTAYVNSLFDPFNENTMYNLGSRRTQFPPMNHHISATTFQSHSRHNTLIGTQPDRNYTINRLLL